MAKAKSHTTAKAKTTMAHPLYLTADERKLFDALSEKLKEGWEVKEEKGRYEDTEKKQVLRTMFIRLTDPKLRAFQVKAKTIKTQQEFLELAKTVDMSHISQKDIAELFFAMGPEDMSVLISALITSAATDEDLDRISYLSKMRNVFYASIVS